MTTLAYVAPLLGCLVLAASCEAGSDDDTGGTGANGSGANGSGAGQSGGAGGTVLTSSGGSGGSGGLAECAGESQVADLTPVDVVIMLDQSGSMDSTIGGQTIWALVTDALADFVQTSDGEGLGVGLQYFPLPDGPCTSCSGCNLPNLQLTDTGTGQCCCSVPTGQGCNVGNGNACPGGGICFDGSCYSGGNNAVCAAADYGALEVPVDDLTANQAAIVASLAAHTPKGLTPTAPALQGAIDAAKARAAAYPDHAVAVVLATDGVPTECSPQDIGQIASLAGAAAAGSPEVLTFVIGIGDVAALNQIAQAGGTNQAFLVDTSGNAGQQFLDALNAIKGSLLQCEFDIPEPSMGAIDFDLVNVQLAPDGTNPETLPQVADEAACGGSEGWYYDDPAAPTQVILCPATCDLVKSQATASIEIVFGCQTIVK